MDDIFNTELSFLSKKAKQRLYAKSLVGKCFKLYNHTIIKVMSVIDKDGKLLDCHLIDMLDDGHPYKYDKSNAQAIYRISSGSQIENSVFDAKAFEFFNV